MVGLHVKVQVPKAEKVSTTHESSLLLNVCTTKFYAELNLHLHKSMWNSSRA